MQILEISIDLVNPLCPNPAKCVHVGINYSGERSALTNKCILIKLK